MVQLNPPLWILLWPLTGTAVHTNCEGSQFGFHWAKYHLGLGLDSNQYGQRFLP